MNDVLRENLECIKKREMLIDLEEAYEDFECDQLDVIRKGEKKWMLCSRIDMDLAIDTWVDQFDLITEEHRFFLFGFGHPDYIRKLIKKNKECRIIIYIPDEILLVHIMSAFDISDLLRNKNLVFICGKNREFNLKYVSNELITNISRKKLVLAMFPNMYKMYPEEKRYFIDTIRNAVEFALFYDSTQKLDESSRAKAYIDAISRIAVSYNYADLYTKISDNKGKNKLAIIVGAGPSLDKNVELLKEVKGKALIIAVDSALKTLLKVEIMPDIICCVDCEKDPTSFRDMRTWDVPLVLESYANSEVAEAHKGKNFYFNNSNKYIRNKMLAINKYVIGLEVGGTVTHAALSLAFATGFENIALIGQDLAYPNGKTHSDGQQGESKYEVTENNPRYYYVEDIFGGQVLTEPNMDFYRKWFEEWCVLHKEINLMDATEGGAKIKGTKIITLRDCIDQYCPSEYTNYKDLIDEIQPILSEEERVKYYEIIKEDYNSLDEIISKLKGAKEDYEKLLELYKKGQCASLEYKKYMDSVSENSDWIEENEIFNLLSLFTSKKESSTGDMMGQVAESEKEGMITAMKAGAILMQGYVEAGERLKKEWIIKE